MSEVYLDSKFSGALICLDGVSRSGKSTIISRVRQEYPDAIVSEWNSDKRVKPTTDQIKRNARPDPLAFFLLHLVDFSYRYFEDILPALQSGKMVICDRYVPTLLARDGLRIESEVALQLVSGTFLRPSVSFYLQPEFKTIRQRYLEGGKSYGFFGHGCDIVRQPKDVSTFMYYQHLQHRHFHKLMTVLGMTLLNSNWNEEVLTHVKNCLKNTI